MVPGVLCNSTAFPKIMMHRPAVPRFLALLTYPPPFILWSELGAAGRSKQGKARPPSIRDKACSSLLPPYSWISPLRASLGEERGLAQRMWASEGKRPEAPAFGN